MDELLAIVRSLSLAASVVVEGFDCDDPTKAGAEALNDLKAEVEKADDFLDMYDMATNQCATLKEAEEEVINQRGGK